MGTGAHIVVAGYSEAANWSEILERAGHRCTIIPHRENLSQSIAAANPNVAMISIADEFGLDVIGALKGGANSRHIPVVAIDVGYEPDALHACCDAGVDDVFEDDAHGTEILARLVPLIRLSGMEAELRRRARTAGDFGITVDTTVIVPPTNERFDLLVVGIDGDEFEALCPALSRTDLRFFAEPDPYRARSRLSDEHGEDFAGALVYLKGGESREKSVFFFRSVRSDRRMFDLPLIVVAEKGAFDGVTDAYAYGASVVAPMPVDCGFVDAHLRMLQRGRALRRALADRLVSALGPNSADGLGSVFSSDFLQAHMQRIVEDTAASGRPSAAILFFVPTIGETAAIYGENYALRLRQQMADWLSSLVRVEDLVGRVGSDEFLMLLPETSERDADCVRKRVTGVLHQSEFGLADNMPLGIEVYVQSSLVGLNQGETLNGLVIRASAGLA